MIIGRSMDLRGIHILVMRLPMMAHWNLSKKKYFYMMMVVLDLVYFRGSRPIELGKITRYCWIFMTFV